MPRPNLKLALVATLFGFTVTACTVTVNQPRLTGVESGVPSRATPPLPTLRPGATVIDTHLKEVVKGRLEPGIRLPDSGEVAPSTAPSTGGKVDQRNTTGGLDFEVKGPGRVGQRFRAMQTGSLTSLEVLLRSAEDRSVTGRLSLYEMNEDGSPGDEMLGLSPELVLLEAGQATGWCRATFQEPVPVSRNVTYVWVLQPDREMAVRVVAGPEQSYPDGTGWVSSTAGGLWRRANIDFNFQTWVQP